MSNAINLHLTRQDNAVLRMKVEILERALSLYKGMPVCMDSGDEFIADDAFEVLNKSLGAENKGLTAVAVLGSDLRHGAQTC